VSDFTQSFFGLTTTVSASYATGISMYSTFLSAASVTSLGVIGRDASVMSVSPTQKRLKPPPVPEMPTDTFTFDACLENSSATASVMG